MNQVANWVVALFAVLQFFTGLSMKGCWAWILRFLLAVVLWSAGWFVIAKLHNMLSSEMWLAGNYAWTQGGEILSGLTKLISVLWHDSSASYFDKITTALQQAHQVVDWHQPDLGDLGHLNMVLFITICLSTDDSSPQAQTLPVAVQQSNAPRQSHPAEQPADSELQHQTIPSGPANYRDHVDPYSVRSLAVSLVSGFPEHGTGPSLRAATLFEYGRIQVRTATRFNEA